MNSLRPADLARSRFAVAQLGQALKSRPALVPRLTWVISHDDFTFDLADVRAITHLARDVETTYQTRHDRRATSEVTMRYSVILSGAPALHRERRELDINAPPLKHEHDKLVKMWLASMEMKAA